MSDDLSSLYANADDIITHLKTVFANLNRSIKAYAKYHKLKMKPYDNYTDFIAEFLLLIEEAGVIKENRKRDLYSKLLPLLKKQVM
jgi:hypothetical protein